MESQGPGRRGRPRGASQAPPIFDQQAFTKAIGVAAAAIAQASAAKSEEETSDLQGFQAHHPLICTGGGDLMVMTASTIKREEDDIRGIWDMSASTKRKKDQLPSNSGKKQKASVLHGSWG